MPGADTVARLAMDMSALRGELSSSILTRESSVEMSSLLRFVKAAAEINAGTATVSDFDLDLPTGRVSVLVLFNLS